MFFSEILHHSSYLLSVFFAPFSCTTYYNIDVLTYTDKLKYDAVVCTELSEGLFIDFLKGIAFLEQFVKHDGTIVFGKMFSEIKNPPQELIDFDGELPTLHDIYCEVRRYGYLITSMTSASDVSWERYIMRDSKLTLAKLHQNPDDMILSEWTDKWHRTYYNYRRPYENWALFGINKTNERNECI